MKLNFPKKKISKFKREKFLGIVVILSLLFNGFVLIKSNFYDLTKKYVSNIIVNGINIPESMDEIVGDLKYEIDSEVRLYNSNGLATLFIDLPFTSLQTIEEKRSEAIEKGLLVSADDDYVSASIHLNDENTIDIKIRLKGDWTDHLLGDKWSYRIHITEDDGAVLGMKRFSLQGPETRNFISEFGYHKNLQKEGVLTTRYLFINVIINGEHKGVYALEESFTEDLLESQYRREGVIIRMNEDLLWENRSLYLYEYNLWRKAGIDEFWKTEFPVSGEIQPFRGKHILEDETLSKEMQTAVELLFSLNHGMIPVEEAIDIELWGKYYAITKLWAAQHSAVWHNLRIYFNPITGLLEPIAFDGTSLIADREEPIFISSDHTYFYSLEVQEAYIRNLEKFTSPAYINSLKEEYGKELGAYFAILAEEYKNTKIDFHHLELPWENLAYRAKILNIKMNPTQPIRGNFQSVVIEGVPYIKLELINLTVLPVEINKIILENSTISFKQEWCFSEVCEKYFKNGFFSAIIPSGNVNEFFPVTYLIPGNEIFISAQDEEKIMLTVNLLGRTKEIELPIYSNYSPIGILTGVKPTVTLLEVLENHPYLVDSGNNQLIIKKGDWNVQGDLVIPVNYELIISADTILRFEKDAVFFSQSNIMIIGSEDSPVRLTSQGDSWGGVVVLNAEEISIWQHVVIEKMAGVSRAGWQLTGGITFYESEIEIISSVIGNNFSEDALNVIGGLFSLKYVEFLNTPSDAFDGDFTQGSIENSSFHDIGGDGFDVSGTFGYVSSTYFVNIEDKAISAGEQSTLSLKSLVIKNVGIGIASKDLSEVVLEGVTIDNANIAGLATYIKKPQYGPGSIIAKDTNIINSLRITFRQLKSYLMLNGVVIEPEDIDIESFYN